MSKQDNESIKVAIRIRPLSDKEMKEQRTDINQLNNMDVDGFQQKCVGVDIGSDHSIFVENKNDKKLFSFDQIFSEDTTQKHIFDYIGKPLVNSIMDGYNSSIFAYGQTGSGKTHTIQGIQEDKGLMNRVLDYMFQRIYKEENIDQDKIINNVNILDEINQMESINMMQEEVMNTVPEVKEKEYLVKISYLEIYNEQIKDLLYNVSCSNQNQSLNNSLNTSNQFIQTLHNAQSHNLQLRESLTKGIYVEGLTEETVLECEHALHLLKLGQRNRQMGFTQMNSQSSRSHAVFSVILESKTFSGGIQTLRTSKLHFIDLAGSERQKQSQVQGNRLKEACGINKSLSVLGYVINSLVDSNNKGKQRHIPYRDSKLTFLLKDSLGGNSKTMIVGCISPSSFYYAETLSTLQFCKRAKQIKNSVSVNEEQKGSMVMLKKELKKLREELSQAQLVIKQKDINNQENNKKSLYAMLSGNNEFMNSYKLNNQLIESQRFFHNLINQYKSSLANCLAYFQCEQHQQQFKKSIDILIKNEHNYKQLLQMYNGPQQNGSMDSEKQILKQLVIKQPMLSKLVEENIKLNLRNKSLLENYECLNHQMVEIDQHRNSVQQVYMNILQILNQNVDQDVNPQNSYVIKQMENIIKELNNTILEQRNKNLNLEIEIVQKEREIQFKNGDIGTLQSNLNKVIKKEKYLDSELVEIHQKMKEKDQQIIQLQDRNGQLDETVKKQQMMVEEQNREIQFIEERNEQLEKEKQMQEMYQQQKKETINTQQQQIYEYKEQINDIEIQLQMLTDKHKYSQKEYNDRIIKLNEEIEIINTAFEGQRHDNLVLKQMVQQLNKSLEQKQIDKDIIRMLVLFNRINDEIKDIKVNDVGQVHLDRLRQILDNTNHNLDQSMEVNQQTEFIMDQGLVQMVDGYLCQKCSSDSGDRQQDQQMDQDQYMDQYQDQYMDQITKGKEVITYAKNKCMEYRVKVKGLEQSNVDLKVMIQQKDKKLRLLQNSYSSNGMEYDRIQKQIQELNQTVDFMKSENYILRSQLKQKNISQQVIRHPQSMMKENQCLSLKVDYLRKMIDKLSQVHGFNIQDIKLKMIDLEDSQKYFSYNQNVDYVNQVIEILKTMKERKTFNKINCSFDLFEQREHSLTVIQDLVNTVNEYIENNQQNSVYLNLRSQKKMERRGSLSSSLQLNRKQSKIKEKSGKRKDHLGLVASMDQIFGSIPIKKLNFN